MVGGCVLTSYITLSENKKKSPKLSFQAFNILPPKSHFPLFISSSPQKKRKETLLKSLIQETEKKKAMEGGDHHQVEDDQPLTPAGRFFLQPEMNQIINCVIGVQNPIDIDSIKTEIKNSIMIQHPRFQSLLVKDQHGREHWRRLTQVDINKHIFIQDINNNTTYDDQIEIVNQYLADLAVSSPLKTDKPLWEIQVLIEQKCFVLRFHHALGDGISLMSLILAMCRKVDQPDQLPTLPSSSSMNRNRKRSISIHRICRKVWELVMRVWFTLVFVMDLMLRICWVRDEKTVISGGTGVELWPRKVATAKFCLNDMKSVKKSVANATINDVLFGVISSGLSRYLDGRSDAKPKEGLQITGLSMVNTRKQSGSQDLSKLVKNATAATWWGNQIGFVVLPIFHHIDVDDPLQYVKRAKVMLDQKKMSLEAYFSYRIGAFVMAFLGPKVATWLNYRIICNTSFTVSNIVGPQEEIMFAGNPITSFRVTSTSLSHAITMHMVSYAGKAEMQILVAKDIIPDPQVLAKYFEDALLEMKDAASAVAAADGRS